MKKIKEHMGRVLRRLDDEDIPDAFLYLSDVINNFWDLPTIYCKDVYHTQGSINPCNSDSKCPFVPIWKEDASDKIVSIGRFIRYWEEEAND